MQEDTAGVSGETGPAFGEFEPRRPVASLLSTTRDVLLSPRRFFDWLLPDGPAGAPSVYFAICFLITSLINALATTPILALPVIFAFTANPAEAWPFALFTLTFLLAFLVVYPILTTILFFVGVAVQHVFVFLMAGRNQRGLRATLRVSCYSGGAIILLAWVPIVGLAAAVYYWYLYTTALRRVHGISTVQALAAILIPTVLFLTLMATGAFFGFKAAREALDEPLQQAFDQPTSYYFPEPETSKNLPPGVVGAAALMDGSRDQAQVRELRKASYADRAPGAESGAMVYFVTADPKDGPRGVEGFVRDGEGETLRIDSAPAKDRKGTDDFAYYASESVERSPKNYYEERVVQPALAQQFALASGGDYVIEVDQIGNEPRIIRVQTYDATDAPDGKACFYVPYRTTEPGTRLRLRISPGEPLDGLRLEMDHDADGAYEESWMPEATVVGPATSDATDPVTKAYLREPNDGKGSLLVLKATDQPASDDEAPSSGVGVIYYWINDSGPRIYTGPLPVENGDVVTYWAIDRAGNLEWRRTADIRGESSTTQASKPGAPSGSS